MVEVLLAHKFIVANTIFFSEPKLISDTNENTSNWKDNIFNILNNKFVGNV